VNEVGVSMGFLLCRAVREQSVLSICLSLLVHRLSVITHFVKLTVLTHGGRIALESSSVYNGGI